MSQNISSLQPKIGELYYTASCSNADVIGITDETKFDSTDYDFEIAVDDFNIIQKTRS